MVTDLFYMSRTLKGVTKRVAIYNSSWPGGWVAPTTAAVPASELQVTPASTIETFPVSRLPVVATFVSLVVKLQFQLLLIPSITYVNANGGILKAFRRFQVGRERWRDSQLSLNPDTRNIR